MNPISAAVITGNHSFDDPRLRATLDQMQGITCWVLPLEAFAVLPSQERLNYDVLVFYNYHREIPTAIEIREALASIGQTPQGLVMLHHSLVAFLDWSFWSNLCGISDRHFTAHKRQLFRVEIANPDHPITRGLESWDMTDETYAMADAGEGSEILLTTGHPLSMKTLAWARQVGQSRVFCYQSGHDPQAYDHLAFRTILERGILWAAH